MTTSMQLTSPSVRAFAKKDKQSQKEKREKAKEALHEEFEGQELDTIQEDFEQELQECLDHLEENLQQIKLGRASPHIFDELSIMAYGERQFFPVVCQTIVKGSNLLMVKVFDEGMRDEVMKALQRSDFDLDCTVEGKDIKVKIGSSKKEQIDQHLKKLKNFHETFKKDVRQARHNLDNTKKKVQKIVPQEEIKGLERNVNVAMKTIEDQANKIVQNKERDIKG